MGKLNQGPNPHIRAIVRVRGETFKAESETADLWQPKWNQNQTVLAAAIRTLDRDMRPTRRTLDRDMRPMESTVAGSWRLGIVEQSQSEGCY